MRPDQSAVWPAASLGLTSQRQLFAARAKAAESLGNFARPTARRCSGFSCRLLALLLVLLRGPDRLC
jgi:hypothetical protein